jgi:hypothetical protein
MGLWNPTFAHGTRKDGAPGMTCQIRGFDAGVLYVSLDSIDGTTSLQWSKVARLESKQLFIVNTEDGSVYIGSLTPLVRKRRDPSSRTLDSSVLYSMPRTARRQDLQRKREPGFGVNPWIFTASISCVSKEMRPQLVPPTFFSVLP